MPDRVIRNIDVVVYVLGKLEGASRKVPTEHIARNCFELAPDRFAWIGEEYRHFPDKYVVKTALEDAAKAEYGSLVKGKYARDPSKDGWLLTPSGVRWLNANAEALAVALDGKGQAPGALPPIERKRFLSRMKREKAYKLFSTSRSLDGITRYMFADMLQASPDAPPELIRSKFDRLSSLAEIANDPQVLEFLELCERKFFAQSHAGQEESDG